MTPEQLKQIAEYMGYNTKIAGDTVLSCLPSMRGYTKIYNPIENAEQAGELLEKFRVILEPWDTPNYDGCKPIGWVSVDNDGHEIAQGKTWQECITNCAREIIKDKLQ